MEPTKQQVLPSTGSALQQSSQPARWQLEELQYKQSIQPCRQQHSKSSNRGLFAASLQWKSQHYQCTTIGMRTKEVAGDKEEVIATVIQRSGKQPKITMSNLAQQCNKSVEGCPTASQHQPSMEMVLWKSRQAQQSRA
jgi:hypothetical protein